MRGPKRYSIIPQKEETEISQEDELAVHKTALKNIRKKSNNASFA